MSRLEGWRRRRMGSQISPRLLASSAAIVTESVNVPVLDGGGARDHIYSNVYEGAVTSASDGRRRNDTLSVVVLR